MGTELERRNARIQETYLGFESHGIFTWTFQLDYGGAGVQGAGGLTLSYHPSGFPRTIYPPGTVESIVAIMSVAGANRWEEVKGKYVTVLLDRGLVRGFAPLLGEGAPFMLEGFMQQQEEWAQETFDRWKKDREHRR